MVRISGIKDTEKFLTEAWLLFLEAFCAIAELSCSGGGSYTE